VPSASPTPQDLDAYREDADRFIAELDEEYYLHFAGLKDKLELEPIYERHRDLTTLEWTQSLGQAVDGDRRIRELWRFACEGHLGNLTKEHSEKAAALETELEAVVDGETVGFRMLRPTIANTDDRGKRERLDKARTELTEQHLNPIYLDAVAIAQGAVPQLGSPNYVELYRRFGYRLDNLADQCRAVLDSTERMYEDATDKLFRDRIGIGLDEAKRWDVPRVFRAQVWDEQFPADKMLPALEATLADFGIDLHAQENVHLDIEQRPSKSPRAFCAPIEVPGRVMLVIQPIGGADDWRALFHEAGHTEHFANTSPSLAMEERRLGDNAVTEGWAMLMQHLTDEPAWLTRRLDVGRPDELAREGATGLLYFVRRYCAKLLYELEFHAADDVTVMRPRYVELLGDALKIEPSETDYLGDIDSGFYVTEYLRSWAFEAQLRAYLRERYGNTWFTKREAGSLLRELWSEGQRINADELLKEVTGAELQMAAVGERVSEYLN
jgi:oligoendopeptidase F